MVDPGSAVGVVSLALQVAQGLSKFYSDFKSFDNSIKSSLQRIRQLEQTLSALNGPLNKLNVDNILMSEQVRSLIKECEDAVQKLDVHLNKCRNVKTTLEELHNDLDRFQASLDTGLLALRLEASIRFEERTQDRAENNDRVLNELQRLQAIQDQRLETINDIVLRNSLQANASSVSLEQNLQHLTLQVEALWKQQNELAQPKLSQASSPTTSYVANCADSTASRGGLDSGQSIGVPLRRRKCRCFNDETLFGPSYSARGPFAFFWRNSRQHRPHCPFYRIAHHAVGWEAGLTYFSYATRSFMEASLKYTSGAGSWSIEPVLKCDRFVEDKHATFSLLKLTTWSSGNRRIQHQVPVDLLDLVKRKIDAHFRDGTASPMDRTEHGTNLLHAACDFVSQDAIVESHSSDQILAFLNFFLDAGVPCDHVARDNGTVIDLITYRHWRGKEDFQLYICSYLSGQGSPWSNSVNRIGFSPSGASSLQDYYYWRPKVLKAVSADDAFIGDPITLAIFQTSILDLRNALSSEKLLKNRIRWNLILSANWPDGLRTLLAWFASTEMDLGTLALYDIPLQFAYFCRNYESAKVLLDHGYSLSNISWSILIQFVDADTLRHYIENIGPVECPHSLSVGLNSRNLYHDPMLTVDGAEKLVRLGYTVVDAEAHRFHKWSSFSSQIVTPLWVHSWRLVAEPQELFTAIGIIQWLLEHGARRHWVFPLIPTTPAHLITAIPFSSLLYHSNRESFKNEDELREDKKATICRNFLKHQDLVDTFLDTVFAENADSCNCACSSSGCLSIQSAFKFNIWVAGAPARVWERRGASPVVPYTLWQDYHDAVLATLDSLLSGEVQLALAILRVLTFEKLGIRHTCHDVLLLQRYEGTGFWADTARTVYDEGEIHELHEEDRHLITKLEEFMDHFDSRYRAHGGTFKSFFDDYWTPHMAKVLMDMKADDTDVGKLFENTGIRFHTVESESELSWTS